MEDSKYRQGYVQFYVNSLDLLESSRSVVEPVARLIQYIYGIENVNNNFKSHIEALQNNSEDFMSFNQEASNLN
jgi:hypothetical protein